MPRVHEELLFAIFCMSVSTRSRVCFFSTGKYETDNYFFLHATRMNGRASSWRSNAEILKLLSVVLKRSMIRILGTNSVSQR